MFFYHNENADAALASAILYYSTNDKKYFNLTESIILTYAKVYKELPLHDYLEHVGDKALIRGARLFSQTLDEANWAIRIALAYDIIHQEYFQHK